MSNDIDDDAAFAKKIENLSPEARAKLERLHRLTKEVNADKEQAARVHACMSIVVARLCELVPGASTDPMILTAAKAIEGDESAWQEVLEFFRSAKGEML